MHPLLSNGYQLIPEVLSQAEIVRLRDAITDTVDRVAHALRTPFEESHPALDLEERLPAVAVCDRAYAAALFHAVMADTQRDPRLGALAEHPGLRAAVSTIISPRPWLGQVIRTRVAMRAPTAHSPWHQDVTEASPPAAGCAAVALACWIPLTDVSATTGALEVMPGRWTAPLPHVPSAAYSGRSAPARPNTRRGRASGRRGDTGSLCAPSSVACGFGLRPVVSGDVGESRSQAGALTVRSVDTEGRSIETPLRTGTCWRN